MNILGSLLGKRDPEPSRFIVGVDLGQTTDPTAIVVVEVRGSGSTARFEVRHLERHLGKPYTVIVGTVKKLVSKLVRSGEVTVGFDSTGVGRAVGDIFRAADLGVPLHGVTITAGDSVTQDGGEYHVPKKDLVGVLQVLFQSGRIRVARSLRHAELLTRELLNFRVKVTAAASETFGAWRDGDHDDFVLAAAIACWLEQRGGATWDMEEFARLAAPEPAPEASGGVAEWTETNRDGTWLVRRTPSGETRRLIRHDPKPLPEYAHLFGQEPEKGPGDEW